jgi:hypothetical protein
MVNRTHLYAFHRASFLAVLTFMIVMLLAVVVIPAPMVMAEPEAPAAVAGNDVLLVIEPERVTVTQDSTFTLTVQVQAGSQQVDGAAAYLDFDPSVISVTEIIPGPALSTVLVNESNNQEGTIDYAAGTFSNFPSGTFTLMQVQFRAVAPSPQTFLVFQFENPRQSDVTFEGASVLTGHRDGTVVVETSPPTAVTINSLTGRTTGPASRSIWLVGALGSTMLLGGVYLLRRRK